MRQLLFGVLTLLACTSECSAHGSIAFGFDRSNIRFAGSQNAPNAPDAQLIAFRNCSALGLGRCAIIATFQNTCMAIAVTTDNAYSKGEGRSADGAQKKAVALCETTYKGSCSAAATVCDGDPAPEPTSAEPEQQGASSTPEWLGPGFRRAVETELTISNTAILILLACCLWIFVSVVSPASTASLKRTASISLWIGLPAALAYADSKLTPNFDHVTQIPRSLLFLWTNVFVALMIGGGLRRRLSKSWAVPDALTLPLATLAFTTVTAMAIELFKRHGFFPNPLDCGSRPYPLLSICDYVEFEEVYICLIAYALLIACGAVLPANSNLIASYTRLTAFARKSFADYFAKSRERQAKRALQKSDWNAPQTAASYPVPAIYNTAIGKVLCLKLKRTQRSSFMGRPLFVLDARMEVTAEEAELVRKYRLGDNVIYESSRRQQRKEATLAHLEMTKGGPSLRDSTGAQLLGVGNTLYRLARAGASATVAALSLRVTVNSLMSGVHVECKSMGELLGAESAIVEAARNLRTYLDTAATFDGREEIIEL